MVRTIWKKELLEQLTSQRFIYCTLVIVSLIWVIGLLRTASYERAQGEKDRIVAETADDLRKIYKYCELRTRVVRTPSPLEVFDRGVTEQKSSIVPIEIYEIPYVTDKHSLSATNTRFADKQILSTSGNPLLATIGTFDVVHVIQIFLSLLAILFACESISGEKEEGTLALMLTMNASRVQIVTGKFLSGITLLNIPIFLGFIGPAIFLIASEHIQLTGDDWLSLIGIWATSLFYIAIFYLIGMATSCYTHSTSTSLIYGLFIWAFLVIVVPGSIEFLVNQQFHRLEDARTAEAAKDELWREYEKRSDDLVRMAGIGDTYPPLELVSIMMGYGGSKSRPSFHIGPIREDARIADFLNILRTGENLRLQYAQKVWHACGPLWEGRPRSLIRLNDQLQRITPAGAYLAVAGGLAGTDTGIFYDFIHQARQYREQILEYLRAHDAFGSMAFVGDPIATREGKENRRALDLSDLPAFAERREPFSQRLGRIAPGLLSLFVYAGLIWLAVIRLFSRYDVTR